MSLPHELKCVLAGVILVVTALNGGCGKSSQANPDGGDGSPTIPDARVTGRHAFDVIAVLGGDGSISLPPNNRFTLVLDADAGLAIAGANGNGAIVGVTSSDGRTFRSGGEFWVGGTDGSPCDSGTSVRYQTFELTIAGDHLTGTATGVVNISCGDCAIPVPFGATLSGTADATPPTLISVGFTPTTPFDDISLIVSEPLPVGATARLVADDGSAVDLVPSIVDGIEPLVVGFTKPKVILRAGQSYSVPTGGLVDFAGQTDRVGPPLRLVTFPAAEAALEDGFESATGSAFGGAMVIRPGGVLPPIAGNTSLYVGVTGTPGLDSSNGRSLSVRLARQAGDTRVRFSYRVVSAQTQGTFPWSLQVGSEGASPAPATYTFGTGADVTEMITVAGKAAYAGPISVTERALPADASDTVLVVIAPQAPLCPGPFRIANAGVLIDDLRLE